MKRTLLISALLAVALTACGKKQEAAAPAPAAQPAAAVPAQPSAADSATTTAVAPDEQKSGEKK